MINLKPQFSDMGRYLEATDILDFNYLNVMAPNNTQSQVAGLSYDITI